MLGSDPPKLKAYPKETVIAEKFEAIVRFGMTNGRMKNFWDLCYLIEEFEFAGTLLQTAISATFDSRGSLFPDRVPVALTDRFTSDSMVRARWDGFINRNGIKRSTDLDLVIGLLRQFFEPLIKSENDGSKFTKKWRSGGWH
jgi:hypothetical protein